jgi:hypothetical protein
MIQHAIEKWGISYVIFGKPMFCTTLKSKLLKVGKILETHA